MCEYLSVGLVLNTREIVSFNLVWSGVTGAITNTIQDELFFTVHSACEALIVKIEYYPFQQSLMMVIQSSCRRGVVASQ